MGTLYIVSTPIGNLSDITQRAITVLGEADRVLAEDTRHTAGLLRRYDIGTPLVSAHAFNEEARSAQIIEWLDAGQTLALVSDAGTPLLSDPGARIVGNVLEAGHTVVPIPGPSAILAALVGAGIEAVPFTFFGFLPRTGRQRRERLEALAGWPHTAVLFEAPARLVRTLKELIGQCGADRRVTVARELTKLHESFVRGTLEEALHYYEKAAVRGEIVIVLAGAGAEGEGTTGEAEAAGVAAGALAEELIAAGGRPSAVARELARRLGMARNEAYEIALAAAAAREGDVA
jgi:16S rRNA (cytidine1402-2'-O)-methyltransferase